MSNIRVTQAQIDALIERAEITVETIYDKVTVVTVKLENGFCLSEASGAVDPANYSEAIGKDICLERIKNRLWELEGYALQKAVHEENSYIDGCEYKLAQRLKNVTVEILTCPQCGKTSIGWKPQENTEDITEV